MLSLEQEKAEGYQVAIPLGESVFLSEKGLKVTAWTGEKEEFLPDDTKCFDFDKIHGEICCRTRRTGDFISIKKLCS